MELNTVPQGLGASSLPAEVWCKEQGAEFHARGACFPSCHGQASAACGGLGTSELLSQSGMAGSMNWSQLPVPAVPSQGLAAGGAQPGSLLPRGCPLQVNSTGAARRSGDDLKAPGSPVAWRRCQHWAGKLRVPRRGRPGDAATPRLCPMRVTQARPRCTSGTAATGPGTAATGPNTAPCRGRPAPPRPHRPRITRPVPGGGERPAALTSLRGIRASVCRNLDALKRFMVLRLQRTEPSPAPPIRPPRGCRRPRPWTRPCPLASPLRAGHGPAKPLPRVCRGQSPTG